MQIHNTVATRRLIPSDLLVCARQRERQRDTHITCEHFVNQSYRVTKSHRMPYLYRSFSAEEPYD